MVGCSRRLGAVVAAPAEFGPLGLRNLLIGGTMHPLAEAPQATLPVGPKYDRQAPHGAGRGDVEEVGGFLGLLLLDRLRCPGDGRPLGDRAGAEKGDLVLGQAERTTVAGMGDLGRPVGSLLPEKEDMREFEALGRVDRGQFQPVGVLPLGDGDQVRHRKQVTQKGSDIDGVGAVEIALRLVPEGLDKDAREVGRKRAEGFGEGRETVRPGRAAGFFGEPRN
ncbi:MAG TPA: hypothetical protein P5244_09200, partial [Syntrophales bacterium]|nr:hypothetical protein [Syntrophales bacterium]